MVNKGVDNWVLANVPMQATSRAQSSLQWHLARNAKGRSYPLLTTGQSVRRHPFIVGGRYCHKGLFQMLYLGPAALLRSSMFCLGSFGQSAEDSSKVKVLALLSKGHWILDANADKCWSGCVTWPCVCAQVQQLNGWQLPARLEQHQFILEQMQAQVYQALIKATEVWCCFQRTTFHPSHVLEVCWKAGVQAGPGDPHTAHCKW